MLPSAPTLAVTMVLTATAAAQQQPSAELIFFTVDGTRAGAPLLPGFLRDSCWSALGASRQGHVYVAISNHLQPGGNVAIYKYDPEQDQMSLVDDIQSVSTAAGNWMANESQYKVHTFLLRDELDQMWFASDDHPPSPFLRGAHVYTINPLADAITDHSQTQPFLLNRSLRMIPNTGQNSTQSGVFVEYYGIKGMFLNPRAPDFLYAITYPDGFLLQHDRRTQRVRQVGQPAKEGAFIFYVDNRGNAYYEQEHNGQLSLLKYDRTTRTSTPVFTAPGFEIGAIAPTSCGEVVYWLIADTREVYRHDCRTDTFTSVATACGTNWWRLYNLSLSPNGEALYYVSNNNSRSNIRRIDLITQACTEVLDVDALLGSRDLCFGGMNVWDRESRFYAPVWTFNGQNEDVGLLKVTVFEQPLTGTPATLSTATGGVHTMDLRAGPDHGGRLYWLLGSAAGTGNGLRRNDLVLPLDPNDAYFWQTVNSPQSANLLGSYGMLDANGRAQASYVLPPGSTTLLGLQLHHAFAVIDQFGEVVFASNAVPVTLGP